LQLTGDQVQPLRGPYDHRLGDLAGGPDELVAHQDELSDEVHQRVQEVDVDADGAVGHAALALLGGEGLVDRVGHRLSLIEQDRAQLAVVALDLALQGPVDVGVHRGAVLDQDLAERAPALGLLTRDRGPASGEERARERRSPGRINPAMGEERACEPRSPGRVGSAHARAGRIGGDGLGEARGGHVRLDVAAEVEDGSGRRRGVLRRAGPVGDLAAHGSDQLRDVDVTLGGVQFDRRQQLAHAVHHGEQRADRRRRDRLNPVA
jgi:hypothetical protein